MIQTSDNPYSATPVWRTIAHSTRLETVITGYSHHGYFRVVADPSIAATDEIRWLDFEELPPLGGYADQDLEPDSCGLWTNGDGGSSLRMWGNCWKTMDMSPQHPINRDFAVGISVYRERKSEWQAVGFQDTSGHTAWFTFGGKETRWGDTIYNSWSEVPAYGYWTRWQLPVGEVFYNAYGRNGLLSKMIFVNDNDTVNTKGRWAVDRITDASNDQYITPRLTVRWNPTSGNSYQLVALDGQSLIQRGTVYWDCDEENQLTGSSTQVTFRTGGEKKVLCRWVDVDRTERWVWVVLQVEGTPAIKSPFRYCSVGDIMIARRFESEGVITRMGIDSLFGWVRPYLQSFDLTTGNTECAYARSGTQHPNKTYTFKGQPSYVPSIVRGGIQIASLANNHTGDYGDDALKETFDTYDACGLPYIGAGLNDGEAWRPVIVNRGNQRIAVFGYCTLTGRDQNQAPYLEAAANKGGFNWARRDLIEEQFAKVRPYVDFVIVQLHIGLIEYVTEPDLYRQIPALNTQPGWDTDDMVADTAGVAIADFMLDHGADLVMCHGPHVPQGVVARADGKYIAYSLGNFLFDQYLPETFPSITFEADVNRFSRVREARIRPIYLDDYIPKLASGRLGVRILNHIGALSLAQNTTIVEPADGSLSRVIATDAAFYSRIAMQPETLTVAMQAVDTFRVTAPVAMGDSGIVESIEILSTGDIDFSTRVGIDQLYGAGNMEAEGAAKTWECEAPNEMYDDSLAFAGRRSVRIRRLTGTGTWTVPTTYRYPIDRNQPYTLHARIYPGGIAGSNIRLDYWEGRVGGNTVGTEQLLTAATAGTQWVELFGNPTFTDNTGCLQIRLRLAAGNPTTSYFDEISLIKWNGNWALTTAPLTFSNPHSNTHFQIRTNAMATTSVRVVLHRARLVARP